MRDWGPSPASHSQSVAMPLCACPCCKAKYYSFVSGSLLWTAVARLMLESPTVPMKYSPAQDFEVLQQRVVTQLIVLQPLREEQQPQPRLSKEAIDKHSSGCSKLTV